MKIPKRVKIGPYTYKVRRKPRLQSSDLRALDGNIQYGKGRINLNTDLSPDRAVGTLFHEVFHGIDDYMNIGLSEEQVDSLACGVLAFLRDNNLLREE